MTANDVQAALARGGWKVETFPGTKGGHRLGAEAAAARTASFDLPRTGLATIHASKGDEALFVKFRPVP